MTHSPLLLGLDLGTQAVKAVLVQGNGVVLGSASLERGPTQPRPGWMEMDPEQDWWGAGLHVIRKLLNAHPHAAQNIAGVGVCGLVPCLCLLAADGQALRNAILYSDNRALDELDWSIENTGIALTAEAVTPKLVWVRRHEPMLFHKAWKVLSAHNYMVYRLTGRACMDYDTAGIMGGVFNAPAKAWNTDVSRKLEIPAALWPDLLPATAVAGQINSEAARQTGLPEGTPVIAGSGDTFPTMVGCGAVEPGDAMISFGTTGLLTVTTRPLLESVGGPHFDHGDGQAAVLWVANVLSAGRLVRWFFDQFAQAEQLVATRTGSDPFAFLETEAARLPAGADGLIVLPHWMGCRSPAPDPTLRGAVLGLTPAHTSGHIYRAMLESFAFNVRQNYGAARGQVQRLVGTAGGARSRLWRQIMCDVLETPIEYHPSASGGLGIAFLAAFGLGLVQDFSDIKTRWLHNLEVCQPNPPAVNMYNRLYPVYCEFDRLLCEPFAHLYEAVHGNWQQDDGE